MRSGTAITGEERIRKDLTQALAEDYPGIEIQSVEITVMSEIGAVPVMIKNRIEKSHLAFRNAEVVFIMRFLQKIKFTAFVLFRIQKTNNFAAIF